MRSEPLIQEDHREFLSRFEQTHPHLVVLTMRVSDGREQLIDERYKWLSCLNGMRSIYLSGSMALGLGVFNR